jgi:hypothetical protein
MATLRISPEKVCYVIAKAREFDVKVAPEEMDDEGDSGRILEDYADDPTYDELKSFLETLNDEEVEDLLALDWLGRGDDWSVDDWDELLGEIRDVRERHTVEYLLGTPMLPDYLEEGLAALGHSCEA